MMTHQERISFVTDSHQTSILACSGNLAIPGMSVLRPNVHGASPMGALANNPPLAAELPGRRSGAQRAVRKGADRVEPAAAQRHGCLCGGALGETGAVAARRISNSGWVQAAAVPCSDGAASGVFVEPVNCWRS